MGDRTDVQTGMAKAHGRTALLKVLEEWELQMAGSGPAAALVLADRADELLDAIAEFIDARAQSRAGMKPARSLKCLQHGLLMPHFGCAESVDRIRIGGGSEQDASLWSEAHLTHEFVVSDDPNFGSAFGGSCAYELDGVVCGYPRLAHKAGSNG